MGRQPNFTSTTPTSAASTPSAPARRPRGRPRKQKPTNHAVAAINTSPTKKQLDDSAHNTSGSGNSDKGVGATDGSEADEKADDDADGNVLAPSGRATKQCADQMGYAITDGAEQVCYSSSQRAPKRHASDIGSISNTPKKTRLSQQNTSHQNKSINSNDNHHNRKDEVNHNHDNQSNLKGPGLKGIASGIVRSDEGKGIGEASIPLSSIVNEVANRWNGVGIDNGLFRSDMSYFGEQNERTDPNILYNNYQVFKSDSINEENEPRSPLKQSLSPTVRHVHFEEPSTPQSDCSDTMSNDIGLEGLFDHNSELNVVSVKPHSDSRNNQDEADERELGGNSSGYESDIGDTTDEEEIPVSATTPQALLRDPALDVAISSAQVPPPTALSPSPFKIPSTRSRRLPGPRIGSFKPNPKKSYGILDGTGDNLLFSPAKQPARAVRSFTQVASSKISSADASPVVTQPTLASGLNDSDHDYSDFSTQGAANPTLTAGLNSLADFSPPLLIPTGHKADHRGEPDWTGSVFFPEANLEQINALYSAYPPEDDGNDPEDLLNLNDFIDYGCSSDEDEEANDNILDTVLPTPSSTSPTAVSAHTQAQMSSPIKASTNGLMAHLDKGVIGAFRQSQNQHRYQSDGPYDELSFISQAFKSGMQAPANSSGNPQTKRKLSSTFAHIGSLGPVPKKQLIHHG